MKLERSRVSHPLWRKKVDKSLFEYNGTPVPRWACNMWGIRSQFKNITSKKDPAAKVDIHFNGFKYQGWVTCAKKGRKTPIYRLWFTDELAQLIKHEFVMSYMRMLEQSLSPKSVNIEEEIPFWEFLDIEYNNELRKFYFEGYYRQKPSFPQLFSRLIGSPPLAMIDDERHEKTQNRIHKKDWKDRSELQFEVGAENVIYVLADERKKLLYVGEAKNLIRRLSQKHPSIPNWNLYRYDALPSNLDPFRIELERMLIRSYATLFPNKAKVGTLKLSDWRLTNDKIDK